MEESLHASVDGLVAFALGVDVAYVVDDVLVELFAEAFVGYDGHDAEEEVEEAEGGEFTLVSHEDEGGDAGFAHVFVECECAGGEGEGEGSVEVGGVRGDASAGVRWVFGGASEEEAHEEVGDVLAAVVVGGGAYRRGELDEFGEVGGWSCGGAEGEDVAFGLEAEDLGVVVGAVAGGVAFAQILELR